MTKGMTGIFYFYLLYPIYVTIASFIVTIRDLFIYCTRALVLFRIVSVFKILFVPQQPPCQLHHQVSRTQCTQRPPSTRRPTRRVICKDRRATVLPLLPHSKGAGNRTSTSNSTQATSELFPACSKSRSV